MKKILSLSLLLVGANLNSDQAGIAIGAGLFKAANEIILDADTYSLFGQLADLFLEKVEFTPEQWAQFHTFLLEGRELMQRKLDPKMSELQAEYEKEHHDLFQALLDPETGNIDFAGTQELLQEALQELQQDERFEEIRKFNEEEKQFKKKVATSVLADLAGSFNNENESGDAKSMLTQQSDQFIALLGHVITSVESKLTD